MNMLDCSDVHTDKSSRVWPEVATGYTVIVVIDGHINNILIIS